MASVSRLRNRDDKCKRISNIAHIDVVGYNGPSHSRGNHFRLVSGSFHGSDIAWSAYSPDKEMIDGIF
ncbi:MAG: hypothetical protein BZY82_06925 [SAR202 cluster bacterium Io17-Chloro-G3]|nr:MAG: hypothetical protein BZY82_06925 [SAR202 cluster bacterium Io17-Chloro-G3]